MALMFLGSLFLHAIKISSQEFLAAGFSKPKFSTEGHAKKKKIDRKYLAQPMDATLDSSIHFLLVDTDNFHFEEGAAVSLWTAKLATKNRMFTLEARTSEAPLPCELTRAHCHHSLV